MDDATLERLTQAADYDSKRQDAADRFGAALDKVMDGDLAADLESFSIRRGSPPRMPSPLDGRRQRAS